MSLAVASSHTSRLDLRSLFGAEPLLTAMGLLIALSLALTLPAMTLDPRLFQEENIWIKPVKFQVALSVYALTLAFFARWLPQGMTARRSYRIYMGAVAFCLAAELLWIGGAAMYGTASHFNIASPVMAVLYGLMGLFAVLLTSASLVYGVAIWRNRRSALAPALRLAIALGLILTFILTVPVATTMSMLGGHHVGTPVNGASVPLLGWSREVGDLRAPHFLATHALHILPLAGVFASIALRERQATVTVWCVSGLFTLAVLGSFALSLMGVPLIPLP